MGVWEGFDQTFPKLHVDYSSAEGLKQRCSKEMIIQTLLVYHVAIITQKSKKILPSQNVESFNIGLKERLSKCNCVKSRVTKTVHSIKIWWNITWDWIKHFPK